ncbi:Fe-S cluster assembly protein HesB, partial [Candidatus Woesearchaeota archaeon]|nr:Fe-S cluster assembly protein HesB [Candidatus Woesearchaeota archaeon]
MSGRAPTWWQEAHAFLLNDDLLGPVVEEFGPDGITSRDDLFQTLVRSIVGQQISVLAADAIWGRLVDHLGEVTPEAVLATDQPSIAACGVTRPKASYIHGLAENAAEL